MRWSASCRPLGGTPRSVSTASRTAAGQPPVAQVQLLCGGHIVLAGEGFEEGGRFRDVEGQVRPAELEHLTLPAQPLDRKGRLGARGEYDVEVGGSLPT